MKFIKHSSILIGMALTLTLTACSGHKTNVLAHPSGFLPNYQILKPVKQAPSDMQIYAYNNPVFTHKNYHAVIVKPVQLYQTATKKGVTAQQIAITQQNLQAALKQAVSKRVAITDQPGLGVATLSIAITGATLEGEGLRPRNILPISAVIKLASEATDLNNKKPILVIEVKFIDSRDGTLLREALTTINGKYFRNRANTAAEFEQLAQTWLKQVLKYTAAHPLQESTTP